MFSKELLLFLITVVILALAIYFGYTQFKKINGMINLLEKNVSKIMIDSDKLRGIKNSEGDEVIPNILENELINIYLQKVKNL